MRGVMSALVVKAADDFLAKNFGAEIASMAKAAYIRDETLTIACLSTVAAQAIKIQEAELIAAINLSTGAQTVKKIKYLS